MTPEQWAIVNSIFHDVADLPIGERARILEAKSGGDIAIKATVNSLLLADASDSSYLDNPAAQSPEFQGLLAESEDAPLLFEGDLLCNRFRVFRLIGEGGMGQVYEAFDQELNVRIALKVIRPEIAAEESMTRRFRHEVRLARSITHTNVCRTFDLERGDVHRAGGDFPSAPHELVFLTMEYVDGETLAALLSGKGALPVEDALSIAEQIAAGISSAHEHGVIHRDLKPQNILLAKTALPGERCRRVVITDFGLARLDAAGILPNDHSTSSHEPLAAGTLAYMSPEQIRGSPVSSATDIYSFGLILFEMVTGKRAFPRESFLHDLGARFGTEPPSAKALNPAIPDTWDDVIQRCLAQHPESRFDSITEAIAALRANSSARWTNGLYVRRNVRWHWISRRLLAGIAAAAIAVSCFVVFLRYRRVETSNSSVAQGALVYMPAVRNETANRRLNDVAQMMTAALAQSSHVVVLDQATEATTLQRMLRPVAPVLDDTTAREVAMRAGASRVVFVTLKKDGSLLRLTVEVQQPETNTPAKPRNHWPRSWTCAMPTVSSDAAQSGEVPGDLLHIVRDAADWVRQTVGEAKEDIATFNTPVEELTTMNWEALSEYAKAQRLRQQNKSDDAVLALQNAVHSDPGFALGWSRMGDILFSVGRDAEGIRAYRNALDAGDQRRLTLLERDRLRGLIAIDTWDYATAENMFHDATVNYDHDYLSWFYRGSVLIQLDRLPEATATLKKSWEISPERTSAPITLASAYFINLDRKAALAVAASQRVAGHPDYALWLEAEDDYLQGRPDDADSKLKQIDSKSGLRALGLGLRVRLAAGRDKPDMALEILRQGIEEDQSTGSASGISRKKMDRAYLECGERRYLACLGDLRSSLSDSADPENFRAASEVLSRAVVTRPPTAVLHEVQAEFRNALKIAPGAEFGFSSEIVKEQLQGDLLLSEGNVDAAVRAYRKVAVKESPLESPIRLGRALARAAEMEGNPTRKKLLTAEAEQRLGNSQNVRPYLWFSSWAFPPDDSFRAVVQQ